MLNRQASRILTAAPRQRNHKPFFRYQKLALDRAPNLNLSMAFDTMPMNSLVGVLRAEIRESNTMEKPRC